MTTPREPLTVFIDPPLREALTKKAKAEDSSVSRIVRVVLSDALLPLLEAK